MLRRALSAAVERYRDALTKEQQIVGALADMSIDLYALSALAQRAEKRAGTAPNPLAANVGIVFARDCIDTAVERRRTTAIGDWAVSHVSKL
jgi:hypothetical protein